MNSFESSSIHVLLNRVFFALLALVIVTSTGCATRELPRGWVESWGKLPVLHRAEVDTSADPSQSIPVGLGSAGETAPQREMTEADVEASPTGVYRVQGRRIVAGSPVPIFVEGYVVIRQREEGYVSSYSLSTLEQNGGAEFSGKLVGVGTGQVVGSQLHEVTTIQSVTSLIPGVDVEFPYMPRRVGKIMTSSTTGRLKQEGIIQLQITVVDDSSQVHSWMRVEGPRIDVAQLPNRVRIAMQSADARLAAAESR